MPQVYWSWVRGKKNFYVTFKRFHWIAYAALSRRGKFTSMREHDFRGSLWPRLLKLWAQPKAHWSKYITFSWLKWAFSHTLQCIKLGSLEKKNLSQLFRDLLRTQQDFDNLGLYVYKKTLYVFIYHYHRDVSEQLFSMINQSLNTYRKTFILGH